MVVYEPDYVFTIFCHHYLRMFVESSDVAEMWLKLNKPFYQYNQNKSLINYHHNFYIKGGGRGEESFNSPFSELDCA